MESPLRAHIFISLSSVSCEALCRASFVTLNKYSSPPSCSLVQPVYVILEQTSRGFLESSFKAGEVSPLQFYVLSAAMSIDRLLADGPSSLSLSLSLLRPFITVVAVTCLLVRVSYGMDLMDQSHYLSSLGQVGCRPS